MNVKKKLFGLAAACAVAVGALTAVGAGTASAAVLCDTTENAPFYAGFGAGGGTSYLFTLSAGRGFRAAEELYGDTYGREWVYGHGAEHPDVDGWVLKDHTDCRPLG
jgi:hypothetical protein